jgi:hypothetical protein
MGEAGRFLSQKKGHPAAIRMKGDSAMRNPILTTTLILVIVVLGSTQVFDLSLSFAQQPTNTPAAPNLTGSVIAEALNVRSGPGADYSAVGIVYKDDVLTISGRNEDTSWLLIAKDNLTGWVSARHVAVSGDAAVLPIATVVAPAPSSAPKDTPNPTRTPTKRETCLSTVHSDITYREVDKSPKEYLAQAVAWKGKVFSIDEGDKPKTFFQAWYFEGEHFSDTHDVFSVGYDDVLPPGVHEGTEVLVCGIVIGRFEATNVNTGGENVSQIGLVAAYVEEWMPDVVPTPVPGTAAPQPESTKAHSGQGVQPTESAAVPTDVNAFRSFVRQKYGSIGGQALDFDVDVYTDQTHSHNWVDLVLTSEAARVFAEQTQRAAQNYGWALLDDTKAFFQGVECSAYVAETWYTHDFPDYAVDDEWYYVGEYDVDLGWFVGKEYVRAHFIRGKDSVEVWNYK